VALFSLLVPVAFFVALELLLAGLGVKPALYDDDPYVGFASSVPLFVEQISPDGSPVLVTASNKLRLFNPQQFPASKRSGAYRIFCVGGSTTYGRPYGDVTSFCGWLRELLPVADPSRRWEVINGGGVSYASYRTALLMEELCRYEPDLFIIYSGHNEFLERRTYGEIIRAPRAVRGLGAIASRTRTFTLMRRAIVPRGREPTESEGGPLVLDEEVRTRLDGSIGPDAYTRDDAFRAQVLRHYRFSLARIVDMARAAGAQAVLVTPASNLRSFSPFKSEHGASLGEGELRTRERLWNLAETARDAGRWQDALAALDQAVAIDPRHADTQHLRGQALDALQRYAEAKLAFVRARDEDVCPLRALAPAREIVLQVAAARGVPLVDFETLVERRSPQGIPGENLFLDHVHPTIEGNRLLAVALLDALQEQAIVQPRPSWNEAAIRRVTEVVEGRLDRRAHGFALMNLSKVLGWAGKLEEARKLSLRAIELAPAEAPVVYQAGLCAHLTGRTADAIRLYRETVEIAPGMATAHGNLGVLLGERGRSREAAVHLRRAIALVGDRNVAYRDSLAETLEGLGDDTADADALPESETPAPHRSREGL
jgi:tetratricopeptide (TPR) repeat protein